MSKKDAIKSKINTLRAVKEMIGLFVSAFVLFGALFCAIFIGKVLTSKD